MCPNNWLFLINYKEDMERGPILYPSSFAKTFFVEIKGLSYSKREPETLLQFEMLCNLIGNNKEDFESVEYKKFLPIPSDPKYAEIGKALLSTKTIDDDVLCVGYENENLVSFLQNVLKESEEPKQLKLFIEDEKKLSVQTEFIGEDLPEIHPINEKKIENVSFLFIDCLNAEIINEYLELSHEKTKRNSRIVVNNYDKHHPAVTSSTNEFFKKYKGHYRYHSGNGILVARRR